MTAAVDQLRQVAAEAYQEAKALYPKRCWPWSHAWSQWWVFERYSGFGNARCCLRCGITKVRWIRKPR